MHSSVDSRPTVPNDAWKPFQTCHLHVLHNLYQKENTYLTCHIKERNRAHEHCTPAVVSESINFGAQQSATSNKKTHKKWQGASTTQQRRYRNTQQHTKAFKMPVGMDYKSRTVRQLPVILKYNGSSWTFSRQYPDSNDMQLIPAAPAYYRFNMHIIQP